MKIHNFSLATLLVTSVLLTDAIGQLTATTDPVGFVTVNITAGTGTAKRNTLFSVPLLGTEAISGQVTGVITGVTANTISNDNAGWTPGALSQPAAPYLIQITSGAAEGRLFLIASSSSTGGAIAGTANTATTVAVSSIDVAQIVDLTRLGISVGTDTYEIYACDTLSSFFGTPETSGVFGGSSPANSDTIVLVINGSSQTFFYRTSSTPARWTRVFGTFPDASNTPLLPYYGMQYGRLAATPISFVVSGGVPTEPRRVAVKNSGITLISQFWPTANSTLQSSGLSSVVTTGATPNLADTVILTSAGSASTYWFDGTNWRRVFGGFPNSNATLIPTGTTVLVNRKGSAAGFTTLSQTVPYNLN